MKSFIKLLTLCLIPAISLLILGGCSLVSFGGLTTITWPESRNQIIQPGEQLWIDFSPLPKKSGAEDLFSIDGGSVPVSGDFYWVEERLLFHPVPDLEPGIRYLFTFSGSVEADDGRLFDADIEIPFYCGSRDAPSVLTEYSPAGGASCGRTENLIFTFSAPMDSGSFDENFSLSPDTEMSVLWNGDTTQAVVTPETEWESNVLYTWTIDENVTDLRGIAAVRSDSDIFITGKDTTPPELISIAPAALSGNSYLEMPGYGQDDVIRFTFSEEIDGESLESSFSLSPSLPGGFSRIENGVYIYDPVEQFIMGTDYYLTLGTKCEDTAGNNLRGETRITFTPDIPEQQVTEVRCSGVSTVYIPPEDFNGSAFPVLDFPDGGPWTQTIEIDFAESFDEPWRSDFTQGITMQAFFPETRTSPDIENITWSAGNDSVTFQASGFERSPAAPDPERHLYKLTIPGGREQSVNRNGSYLVDDVWIILEAERE